MLTPRTISFPKSKPSPRFVIGLLTSLVSCNLSARSQVWTYAVATPAARRAESKLMTNILRDGREGALEVEVSQSKGWEKRQRQVNRTMEFVG